MSFVLHKSKTEYYTCMALDDAHIKHMFATRVGGVSPRPFDSLNFAEGSGDIRDTTQNVIANYEAAANELGYHSADVCRAYQAHTANVMICDESSKGMGITFPRPQDGIDALVTAKKGVVLSVRTADCVPILLCDPVANVAAAVHSGWRGTAQRISAAAVSVMTSLGAQRERIIAAIGPCAHKCCYEVGDELKNFFASDCFEYRGGKLYLDLVSANMHVLTDAGINALNIYDSGLCTVCRPEHFFSHRRDGVNRGVMAAFIVL